MIRALLRLALCAILFTTPARAADVSVTSSSWTDLGAGPLSILDLGPSPAEIGVSDVATPTTAPSDAAYQLAVGGMQMTTGSMHVWARWKGAATTLRISAASAGLAGTLAVQAVDGATGGGSASSAAVFSAMPVDMTGATALYLTFTAVGSGTVVFEGSNDGVNWAPVTAIRVDSSSGAATQASATVAGATFMMPAIAQQVRARVSVYSSGTFSVAWVKKATPPFAALAALTAAYGVPTMTVKTTGGVAATLARIQSAASTNAASVKASATTLYSVAVANTGATTAYLKLYNKASAPTVGTDTPVATIMVPAGTGANVPLNDVGVSFSAGLAYAITGGASDSDTTAVTANQVVGFLSYS